MGPEVVWVMFLFSIPNVAKLLTPCTVIFEAVFGVFSRGMDQKPSPCVDEQTILQWAKMAWAAMQTSGTKPNSRRGGIDEQRGFLGMTHAGYLKLFQLSGKLLGRTYDVIMLDEAQDSNPCIADIVLREAGCGRILVGDSHQVG